MCLFLQKYSSSLITVSEFRLIWSELVVRKKLRFGKDKLLFILNLDDIFMSLKEKK